MVSVDDVATIAAVVRREYGQRFPAAPVRESHADRERRLERTKHQLETEILPLVNEERIARREVPLTTEDEDRVVETILSAMFLLPALMGTLEREPLAEDLIVLGKHGVSAGRSSNSKFGSVCRYASAAAPTDVLIVPRPVVAPPAAIAGFD